jgi:hypothetical protein
MTFSLILIPNLNVVTKLLQLEPVMFHLVHLASTRFRKQLTHEKCGKRTVRRSSARETVKFLLQ